MAVLPPLSALQALDRIDRLGSAQATAEALNVTPSAVSHRIRTLDAALGFPVVMPEGRGVRLTPRAARYLAEARPALAALEAATSRASAAEAASGPLTVAAPPGFASAWLAPRLLHLRAASPGVALTLTRAGDPRADAEILFAETAPGGGERLATPEFFPVASPGEVNRKGGLRSATDFGRAVFLHLFDRRDWRDWAEHAGVGESVIDDAAAEQREIVFHDANLLLAAAAAGQGVALGDAITCDVALAEGRLAAPFAAAVPSRRAYWLRISDGASQAAPGFATWLRTELGGR